MINITYTITNLSKIGRSYSGSIFHAQNACGIKMISLFPDSYDYLKITDGGSHPFGVFCGERTGESIEVTGDLVVFTFYSDDIVQLKGFLIFFTAIPLGR